LNILKFRKEADMDRKRKPYSAMLKWGLCHRFPVVKNSEKQNRKKRKKFKGGEMK
jgi:hypothetical protein